MKFKLDFNIYSSEDRCKAVEKILEQNKEKGLTQSELQTLSDYILYGKDQATGTSVVDRKEVQIKTKFSSYQKQRFVSLDEMMENPTFDEAELNQDRTIYKKIKPSIDKEKAKTIPEMKQLWEEIERQQDILDQNTGKKERTDAPVLNQKEIYFLKHHLIQLRTHQYYLMDSYFPTIGTTKNYSKFYQDPYLSELNYPILPRGTAKEKKSFEFINPFYSNDDTPAQGWTEEQVQELDRKGKLYFDFRNKEHLYLLVKNFRDLKAWVEDQPQSPIWELLWTFDIYQELTELTDQQILILEGKKKGLSNKEIQKQLQEELGIFHQVNYISTIYLKLINKIIESVELNYDEWLAKDYFKGWKKCNTCGRYWLRDPRRFVRKTKSPDGLMNRCKACDKIKRQGLPFITYDVVPPQDKIEKRGIVKCE